MTWRSPPLHAKSLTLATVVSLGLGLAPLAHADLGPIFALGVDQVEALDDEDLSELRGRFSVGNGVLEIGVDLRSIWQSPNGTTLSASAQIQANATEISTGTARISTSASAVQGSSSGTTLPTSTSAAPRGTITGSNPVENVNGLAQAVQVAGDRNQVANRLQLDVTRSPPPPGGLSSAPATILSSPRISEATLPDGSRAVAQIGPGGLRVAIDVAGVGSTQQRLGNAPEHSGIMQSVRIASDAQAVANAATIRLTLAPTSPATAINEHILQTMRAMQGLRR
jgi:hypothetical protein